MAGEGHLLTQLRALLEGLDDEALITLSSTGLLRRARKDLQSLTPVVSDSGESLEVDLGAHRVRFDLRGPSQALCTCPAKTTCQHVLAAWLHLRKTASAAAERPDGPAGGTASPEAGAATGAAQGAAQSSPDLVSELMALSAEALIRFAGLPAVRESLAAVESSDLPVVEIAKQLKIRLAHPAVELRYAGGGLNAFVLDYRGKRREKLIVQAVLAFQKANGSPPPALPVPTKRRKAEVAPADRTAPEQLLTQVLATLIECVKLGVLHLSENMSERLLSQAAAAEGAGLHRLSLALTRLEHHIDLQLGLNAGTSSTALLNELAVTYALASAIRAAPGVVQNLWGEARSEYEDITQLDLIGVAAEPWRTASGYKGLTLLLWSTRHKRWYSATESRPAGVLGFDPVKQYKAGGPWSGCNSPAAACGASVTLTSARMNRAGRLSLSESTRAQISDLSCWPEFSEREFSSWTALRESVQADTSGVGLAEVDPHAAYVVLRPTDWLDARFDPTAQELSRVVIDEDGEPLALCLRYSALARHAIERLEALRPKAGVKLLGRVERVRSSVNVRPIALLQDAPARRSDNLFLDEAPRAPFADELAVKLQGLLKGVANEPDVDAATGRQSATDTRLRALEDEILRCAEKGTAAQSIDASRTERLEDALRAGGIDLLPGSGGSLETELPQRLLRLKYCLLIVRELQGS
jgi:hypothetical protein